MAEFKFSCPHCSQHIQCDTGYSGAQINCPSCQRAIIVPPAPHAAAPPPPPPPPPVHAPALATRHSTAAPATGRQFAGAPGAQPAARQKSHGLRNTLIGVAVAVVCAAISFTAVSYFIKHEAKVKAGKGNPAAQVATPTATAAADAEDVLMKVHHAYTGLTSLKAEGTSVMVIDMSAVTAADLNPNQSATAQKKTSTRRPANIPKGMTNMTDVTMKLSRPNLYRIVQVGKMEAGRQIMTNTTAAWSSGATNFVLTMIDFGRANQGYKNYTVAKDRNAALTQGGGQAGLAMVIPQLFFDDLGGLNIAKIIKDWGQTEDNSSGGQECYTLTGKIVGQKLKIWISKSSYLILKSEITLGAPISDDDFNAAFDAFTPTNNMSAQQLAQMKTQAKQQLAMMTKIRGTLTETYDDIETNQTYSADDFNYPVPHGVRLNAPPTMGMAAASSGNSKEVRDRNACINNLRQLDAAKNQFALEKGKTNGAPVTEADLKPYVKLDANGNLPKCPAGGKYTIGKVGESPTCSVAGHFLP